MSLYYFDLHDGDDHKIDDRGLEFERFNEARNHAVSLLPDIAREELPNGPRRDFICDMRVDGEGIVYQAVLKFREDRFGIDVRHESGETEHARCTDDVTSTGSHTHSAEAGAALPAGLHDGT